MFINIYTYIFIEFISHQQMTSKSLWNDGIHLLDTGKSILGQNFEDRASFFSFLFLRNDSFLTNRHFQETIRTIDFEFKTKWPLWKTNLFWLLWAVIIACKKCTLHFLKRALDAKYRHKEMKALWLDKLILDHLNINSIRNKFEALKFTIDHDIDIFFVSESKLVDSFPTAQFLIKAFSAPKDVRLSWRHII